MKKLSLVIGLLGALALAASLSVPNSAQAQSGARTLWDGWVSELRKAAGKAEPAKAAPAKKKAAAKKK